MIIRIVSVLVLLNLSDNMQKQCYHCYMSFSSLIFLSVPNVVLGPDWYNGNIFFSFTKAKSLLHGEKQVQSLQSSPACAQSISRTDKVWMGIYRRWTWYPAPGGAQILYKKFKHVISLPYWYFSIHYMFM